MAKKLYKNTQNKMLCGVCAGMADYLDLDVTVVRLLWVVFGCMGAGVVAYIVAACIMPEKGNYIEGRTVDPEDRKDER